jgi:enoyl-CoA hydratase/carnithine racemase
MNDTVRCSVMDHVAMITLDRPERRSAINGVTRAGLNAA